MSEEGEVDEWFDPRQLEVIGPEEEEDQDELVLSTLDVAVGPGSSWTVNPVSQSESQRTEVGYEALEMVVEDVPMNGLIIEDFQLIVDHLPDVHVDRDQSIATTTSNLTKYELLMSFGWYLLAALCVIRYCCCGWFKNHKREHGQPSSHGQKTSSSSSSVVVQINDILTESKESLWYTNTYISSQQMISVVNDLHDCVHTLREKVRDDCRIRDPDPDHDSPYDTHAGYSNKSYHEGPSESMLAEYKDLARRIEEMITDITDVIEPLVLQEGVANDGLGRGLEHGRNQRHRLGGYGGTI